MPPAEPALSALSNPLLRYFLATRPRFLIVTFFAALIGIASAEYSGLALAPLPAAITVVFALVAHAGINVLNDYYDELNGTDRINTERVFPFTGGSRFIQNGILTLRETAVFGAVLMLAVVLAGLWLMHISGLGLLLIGALGMFIGWAYSAPPLKLNSRGVGEVCVWAGFTLVAIGADYVQRGNFSMPVLYAAAAYALLVTNILFINQFPDCRADKAAGKHHWVVRLGPERARWVYSVIAATAYGWLGVAVMSGHLPIFALIALAPAALSFKAGTNLMRYATRPQQLEPAIKMTIAAASAHGLLLAAALFTASNVAA
ncbi:MAG: prenyltransferase [Betaproteobacteria bacterium]|nr:prenyltransferase [Betaproteobacteria bacterium]